MKPLSAWSLTWPLSLALALTLAAALPPVLAAENKSGEGFSAGLSARPLTNAEEIGLPVYPGAVAEPERGDDSAGASLSLWGGPFALDLRVMKLRSADGVDSVARYYREAMARQGRLVDCSAGAPVEPPAAAASQGKLLRCDGDRAKPGQALYKLAMAGGGVRMVAIEPAGRGSRIQLLRLNVKGD